MSNGSRDEARRMAEERLAKARAEAKAARARFAAAADSLGSFDAITPTAQRVARDAAFAEWLAAHAAIQPAFQELIYAQHEVERLGDS